jgi:PPM family protein phosphatase
MKFLKKILGILDKKEMLKMAEGATDVGKVREGNEDYYLVRPERKLYIVADGMGGHNAGEVASKNATEIVDAYFTPELLSQLKGDNDQIREEIIKGVLEAHQKVFEMAENNQDNHGMGCTIVVALIDGNSLHLCHVGDARAYTCNDSGIKLLTKDHTHVMSLVDAGKMTMEEARESPLKSELTQAIGAPISIDPGYGHYTLKNGDKVLLCSDGLWDMLTDKEIYEILRKRKPVKTICQKLIEKANEAGGNDNVTVAVIRYENNKDVPENKRSE